MERKKLGRYLGPSINVGDAMCGKVLTEKAQCISRTLIIPLSPEEWHSEGTKRKKEIYTNLLNDKLKSRAKAIKGAKSAKQLVLA